MIGAKGIDPNYFLSLRKCWRPSDFRYHKVVFWRVKYKESRGCSLIRKKIKAKNLL